MSAYTNGIAQTRLDEISARLTERMQQVSGRTGIDFSTLFTRTTARAAAQTEPEERPEQGIGEAAEITLPAEAPPAEGLLDATGSYALATGREAYGALIEKIAETYEMDPVLIAAVIQAESGFNPYEVSPMGATGLMQLMPATAAGLGVTDSFDPEQNIDGGVRYLLGQIIRYGGDVCMALAAYNCGPNGITSRGITDLKDPEQFALLPTETQIYLDNITAILKDAGREDLLDEGDENVWTSV